MEKWYNQSKTYQNKTNPGFLSFQGYYNYLVHCCLSHFCHIFGMVSWVTLTFINLMIWPLLPFRPHTKKTTQNICICISVFEQVSELQISDIFKAKSDSNTFAQLPFISFSRNCINQFFWLIVSLSGLCKHECVYLYGHKHLCFYPTETRYWL